MSSINGEWKIVKRKKRKITQSEEVRGPGAVRRHIVARANAPKSTKPGLPPPTERCGVAHRPGWFGSDVRGGDVDGTDRD